MTPTTRLSALALASLASLPIAAHAEPHTFELAAPDAHAVFVAGEMTRWDEGKQPMHRDPDGRWRATLDLGPGEWIYKFVVDGRWIADPSAESDADGRGGRHSILFVGHGDWDARADVPHGRVETAAVPSAAWGRAMKVNVYLPPAYDRARAYPVLWLLHGGGMDADQWYRTGHVERYMDNLLARGAIRPFVIVMPSSADVSYVNQSERFVTQELPAWVAATYGLRPDRAHSAAAGMSMGGFGAFYLPLKHPDLYGASIAISGYYPAEFVDGLAKPLALPMQAVLLAGSEDTLVLDTNHHLKAALEARGTRFSYREDPGAHTWQYFGHRTSEMLVDADAYFTTGRVPGVPAQ
jgi:enterochelin esterase-like enzyme